MPKRKKKLSQGIPVLLTIVGLIGLGVIIAVLMRGKDIILLNPKGLIADQQLKLMITATLIMLEIAIPALFFVYYFAWKYRETNEKATYEPNPRHGKLFTIAIWTFPTITMLLLAVLLVPATYKLQPKKPIHEGSKALSVQVVAMRWKWLFIYPEHNIATVNYVQIPIDTPVQFELTADETPMSSFWIPHLGGQLYAMTEHVNRLNLIADTLGDYEGSAAEINGSGFAGMRFNTRVSTKEDFDKWVQDTAVSSEELNSSEYERLLEPSENHPAAFYSKPGPEIYSNILSKYAGGHEQNTETGEHTGH
ncbi:MAG: COX aromatic rich motif-containing protein [bacterium]|nr:COX aromatic rich motif-containing protein [bacterium]